MIRNKKVYLILLIIIIFNFGCSEQKKTHIGKWSRLNNQGETVVIQFAEDGLYHVFVGKNYGNEKNANQNEQILLNYEFDYSTKPIRFNLYQGKNTSNIEAITSGIVEFLGKDTMQLLLYSPKDSILPDNFMNKKAVKFCKIKD